MGPGLAAITAHFGGAPLEELVVPLLTGGGALLVVVRAHVASWRHARAASRPRARQPLAVHRADRS
jgi:hypothetical protein